MDLLNYLLDLPTTVFLLIIVFALAVGSFFNVAIYRLPRMLFREWHQQCQEFLKEHPQVEATPKLFNLFLPRSHCPHCNHEIQIWHNIPIISYLLLRGKCKYCQKAISLRYPLVELITVLLALIITWKFGLTWQAASVYFLTGTLLVASLIDYDHQILPDSLTLGLMWIGLLLSIPGFFTNPTDAIIGAAAGYLFLWSIAYAFKLLTGKDGMGHGDFKLAAALGAWLGWQMLPLIFVASSLVGAIVGILLIVLKRHQRSQPIPFGPYLAAAGWIALMWGNDFNNLYLTQILS